MLNNNNRNNNCSCAAVPMQQAHSDTGNSAARGNRSISYGVVVVGTQPYDNKHLYRYKCLLS